MQTVNRLIFRSALLRANDARVVVDQVSYRIFAHIIELILLLLCEATQRNVDRVSRCARCRMARRRFEGCSRTRVQVLFRHRINVIRDQYNNFFVVYEPPMRFLFHY